MKSIAYGPHTELDYPAVEGSENLTEGMHCFYEGLSQFTRGYGDLTIGIHGDGTSLNGWEL
jgi:hypothetical protein